MDLPDDLSLPLASGADWWYWLGGRPALDFANTLRERWWRRVETLVIPEDLARWAVAAELLVAEPTVAPDLLAQGRALREAIDAGVTATLAGERVPDDVLSTIDAWLVEAALPDRLERAADGAARLVAGEPADPARHALGLVARDAALMLGTEQHGRIRICASETCSARFYDRSPAGRRRWCSMRGCGNAAKARRHRARQA